jgi:predicted alpha/beta-hydrolase family hydrolase
MNDVKKGRQTRRRTTARGVSRTRGAALSGWLQDRFALAQKAAKAAHAAKPRAEEVSYQPEWVVEHAYPNREARRAGRHSMGRNTPYVNLARDAKRGRHLRGAK